MTPFALLRTRAHAEAWRVKVNADIDRMIDVLVTQGGRYEVEMFVDYHPRFSGERYLRQPVKLLDVDEGIL